MTEELLERMAVLEQRIDILNETLEHFLAMLKYIMENGEECEAENISTRPEQTGPMYG